MCGQRDYYKGVINGWDRKLTTFCVLCAYGNEIGNPIYYAQMIHQRENQNDNNNKKIENYVGKKQTVCVYSNLNVF